MTNNLHIAVTVNPSRGLSLHNDLLLLKVALIYADKVTLYSGTASIMLSLLGFFQLEEKDKVNVIGQMVSVLPNGPEAAQNLQIVLAQYDYLQRKKNRTREEIILVKTFPKKLTEMCKALEDQIKMVVESAGTSELVDAIDSGLVEVNIYGTDNSYAQNGQVDTDAFLESFVQEYVSSIGQFVREGEVYPLFEESAGKLVRAAIKAGMFQMSEVGLDKTRHAGMVSGIMQRLPKFETASISEVLAIRREIEKPLVRFRSAMVRFSNEISHQPWDDEFNYDVEKVFMKEVAPAVLEIEEAVRANSLISKILTKVKHAPVVNTASLLGVVVGKAADFADVSSYALGLAASTGLAISEGINDWRRQNQDITHNQIYFYYEAGRRLK